MSRSNVRIALLSAAGLFLAIPTACSIGPHQCLQMSDCDHGYVCVDGTCETPEPLTVAADDDGGVDEASTDTATDQ